MSSTAALGKQLSPLTLSESLSVPTTGHGHQEAAQAVGTLTLYNGSFTSETIEAGTTFTATNGVQVTTDQTITIPPGNPPTYGEATVTAHAAQAGSRGNINAGAINITVSSDLLVKNSQFSGGQDERDFNIVNKDDITRASADLRTKVTASMTAALRQQLIPTEQMQQEPCNPTVTANHSTGEEARTVTVTVALSCTAIAYDVNALEGRATQLLTTQARERVGTGYTRYGKISVTVTKASTTNKTVVLTFTSQGTWMYLINQSRIQNMVSGKTRLEALHLLVTLPGIQHATISGIADDQELPTDVTHIHLLMIYATF